MKVKLLTSISGVDGAFDAGCEYECSSAVEAERFVDAGIGEYIRSVKVETTTRKTKTEKSAK